MMKISAIKKDLLMGLLLFCGACGTSAQTQAGNPDPIHHQPAQTADPVRGTASVEELAQSLFAAIQSGNTGGLEQHFLTDREIEALHRMGSPDLEAVLEGLDAAQIQSQFMEDYARLVETATGKEINWAEVNLGDVRAQKQTNQDQSVFPVEVTLTDRANQNFQIVFEVVHLDSRYFLFRRLAFV